jgi:hypothetical protein
MSCTWSRRGFLKVATAGAAATTLSREEHTLLAQQKGGQQPPDYGLPDAITKGMPMGRIGNVTMSRLIAGGNLINGVAHARDLVYVSPLVRHYFTDDKILETMERCEENGINTMSTWASKQGLQVLQRHWKNGGKLQWLGHSSLRGGLKTIKTYIDNGAIGIYIAGDDVETLVTQGKLDVLAKGIELIRENGLIAGIACHMLRVPQICEEQGIKVDFYMKTLHSGEYWSATPLEEQTAEVRIGDPTFQARSHTSGIYHDNIWCIKPDETIRYMENVQKPWMAFKVLAAGAIPAKEGFQYALENGADFLHVGMFDFQVEQDALFMKSLMGRQLNRKRPWCA